MGAAVVVLLVATPVAPWAQVVPLGPEFELPGTSVVSDAAGNFVVFWNVADGGGWGIAGQRFDAAGAPRGLPFAVTAHTTAHEGGQRASSDDDGNFVVVWTKSDGGLDRVQARRFDAAGNPAGDDFPVGPVTDTYEHGFPSIASHHAGAFAIAWNRIDRDHNSVFVQRYDASGDADGAPFLVNADTSYSSGTSALAWGRNGELFVAWDSFPGVRGKVYDATGAAAGGEFWLRSSPLVGPEGAAAVAPTADGGFVAVWSRLVGSAREGFGRRFDASGAPRGPEFSLDPLDLTNEVFPSVASRTNEFLVVWDTEAVSVPTEPPGDIAGQWFDATAAGHGVFPVNEYTTDRDGGSTVAADAAGRYVVTWLSWSSVTGVRARRYGPDLIFKDGFESGDLSAWSTAATSAGDLQASTDGALGATAIGLKALVNDTTGRYVQDDSPADEGRYRARFHFDTNGFDPGEAGGTHRTRLFVVFEEFPSRRMAAIVLRRLNGAYGVMGRVRLDDNAQAETGFSTVADGPHVVELDWQRSSTPDANDGHFELWLDGVSVAKLEDLDNHRSTVDHVRLGALSVKGTASGTLYWDEFESRRATYIGP